MAEKIKLSCIIPSYNTPESVIEPNLVMLNNQIGIDYKTFEVIIVDDCSTKIKLSDKFLKRFTNLNIRYIKSEVNVGPGIARQIGIDAADGEYLMFCDADDMLHSVGIINSYLSVLQTKETMPVDMIYSDWIEEQMSEGKYIYIKHESDTTWMHGKVYRKQFLTDNNIRFHENLRLQEDTYFNGLAFALAKNVKKIDAITYVWKFVDGSITRNNDAEYTYNAMGIFVDAVDYLIESLMTYNVPVNGRVLQLCLYIYFNLQMNHWFTDTAKKFRPLLEERIAKFFTKYYSIFQQTNDGDFINAYNNERMRLTSKGVIFERETWSEFLQRVVYKNTPQAVATEQPVIQSDGKQE